MGQSPIKLSIYFQIGVLINKMLACCQRIMGCSRGEVPSCIREEEEDCLICYEMLTRQEWRDNEILRFHPCGHFFHMRCFYQWLFQRYNDKPQCIKCRRMIEYFDMGSEKKLTRIPVRQIISRSKNFLEQEKKNCRIIIHVDGMNPVSFYGGWEKIIRLHLLQCFEKEDHDAVRYAMAQIMSSALEYDRCLFLHHLPAYFYFSKPSNRFTSSDI